MRELIKAIADKFDRELDELSYMEMAIELKKYCDRQKDVGGCEHCIFCIEDTGHCTFDAHHVMHWKIDEAVKQFKEREGL